MPALPATCPSQGEDAAYAFKKRTNIFNTDEVSMVASYPGPVLQHH